MTISEIFARLQQEFPQAIVSQDLATLDPFVVIATDDLPTVAQFLRDDPACQFAILSNLSAVDYLETDTKKLPKAGFEPHLEVIYHLASFAFPGRRLTLKVILTRWKNDHFGELPEVPTVSHIWRTADWHEREAYDLFGIRFIDHPDPRRILMSDDWVGYPLRKDYEFPVEYHDIRCR